MKFKTDLNIYLLFMKQIFIIIFLAVSQLCTANPVDLSKAYQEALQFIKNRNQSDSMLKSRTRINPQLELAYTHDGEIGNVFYVFNQSQDQGFVIVSADDRSTPILGYADKGSFDISNLPDGLKDLLTSYEKQISYAVKNNIGKSRAPQDWTDIEPLIQTQWDQHEPYNNLCPIDPNTGDRSITGCGATAIAQLLYYHQFPTSGKNSISYVWNDKTYSADFSKIKFEWDKMKLTYDDDTPDVDNAVATLMYYCALSMKSEFTSEDTNSWFDTEFLSKYFDFKNEINLLWKEDTSDDEFENIIYQDLLKGLPVFSWAEASEINGWSHLFLIDGCNKDGLFHMNFGWGGYCDGYYLLTPIETEWINMDIFQCVLNNIQPDIPGKWFVQTNDGRYFEMSSVGGIEADPESETDLLLLDLSGNIIASGFTEATFIQTGGASPISISKGDANSDGNINSEDIVAIVKSPLGEPVIGFNKTAADYNGDGIVNIADILCIVAIIMGK